YKVFQLVEVGGTESHIEVVWGLGVVHWQKEGYVVDRPLLERRVGVELDDAHGGLIRIRPTSADPKFDLKPDEALGRKRVPGLARSDRARNYKSRRRRRQLTVRSGKFRADFGRCGLAP